MDARQETARLTLAIGVLAGALAAEGVGWFWPVGAVVLYLVVWQVRHHTSSGDE